MKYHVNNRKNISQPSWCFFIYHVLTIVNNVDTLILWLLTINYTTYIEVNDMNNELNGLKEQLTTQQYLKNAQKKNQFFYASLLEQKLHGKAPEIESLTKEELVRLCLEEALFDKQVASLFAVSKQEVQELRNTWNITRDIQNLRIAI
jgi:hypothetical protein